MWSDRRKYIGIRNDCGGDATGECKVTVDASVCKMITVMDAGMNDDGEVEADIKSGCPAVLRMSCGHKTPPFRQVMCDTDIASEHLVHTAHPVPSGILKAIEVAGELGIRRDANIRVE